MWNSVALVAKTNNIPEADLVDFAISRDAKYGIVVENGDAKVSNWSVEELLKDFEAFRAEDDLAEIEYMIEQYPHLANAVLDVGCEFDPKLEAYYQRGI